MDPSHIFYVVVNRRRKVKRNHLADLAPERYAALSLRFFVRRSHVLEIIHDLTEQGIQAVVHDLHPGSPLDLVMRQAGKIRRKIKLHAS